MIIVVMKHSQNMKMQWERERRCCCAVWELWFALVLWRVFTNEAQHKSLCLEIFDIWATLWLLSVYLMKGMLNPALVWGFWTVCFAVHERIWSDEEWCYGPLPWFERHRWRGLACLVLYGAQFRCPVPSASSFCPPLSGLILLCLN